MIYNMVGGGVKKMCTGDGIKMRRCGCSGGGDVENLARNQLAKIEPNRFRTKFFAS